MMEPNRSASDEARAMLDAFACAGTKTLDVTTTTRYGRKEAFRRGVPIERFRAQVGALIEEATRTQLNVIVRPHATGVQFVQLDDLCARSLEQVREIAFLGLQTSPGNYQAWVAISSTDASAELSRGLRRVAGADRSASGAMRIAGSLNFKDRCAPKFPRVEMEFSTDGLIAGEKSTSRLLIGKDDERGHAGHRPFVPAGTTERPRARKWPSYDRCVEAAPMNREGTHADISRADFTWCMIAIDWGWNVEETVVRLLAQSPRPRRMATDMLCGPHGVLLPPSRAEVLQKAIAPRSCTRVLSDKAMPRGFCLRYLCAVETG